jgi:hypothetical protein
MNHIQFLGILFVSFQENKDRQRTAEEIELGLLRVRKEDHMNCINSSRMRHPFNSAWGYAYHISHDV